MTPQHSLFLPLTLLHWSQTRMGTSLTWVLMIYQALMLAQQVGEGKVSKRKTF